jgi:TATA-box binding protein (TBP) (component of TFIID and TFIIIB)
MCNRTNTTTRPHRPSSRGCQRCSSCKKASSTAHNLFAEYIENSHVCLEDMAQVHNLVCTSRIVSKLDKLDLRAIINMMPNSKFEKQKFEAITIRLGQPVFTVLLFTSGKMVLTGCKSMLDCILASTSVFHHMMQGFPGVDFQLEPVKIQNIVGNEQISLKPHEKLDFQKFYQDHNIFCTYQPHKNTHTGDRSALHCRWNVIATQSIRIILVQAHCILPRPEEQSRTCCCQSGRVEDQPQCPLL